MKFRAVIFDLGGVVLGSPLHAIAQYEQAIGIPAGFVNRVVMTTAPVGAWSRLERGELTMEAFFTAFERDCAAAGREISARDMMERIGQAGGPRESMLEAVDRIRARGLQTAALTNNWATEDAAADDASHGALRGYFDVFVESSVEGLRKPDPRIYELTCQRLGIAPRQAVFLDDIGANLKPARALGLTTIKVSEPRQALDELSTALGFAVVD